MKGLNPKYSIFLVELLINFLNKIKLVLILIKKKINVVINVK